jgi:hypothetical protein
MSPGLTWKVRPFLQQWGLMILLVVMFIPIGGTSLGGRILIPVMDGFVSLLVGF